MRRLRPQFLTARFQGPVALSDSGWRWWLADECALVPVRMLDAHLQGGATTGITLLREKGARSRRLYRLASGQQAPVYFAKQMALAPHKRLGALLGHSSALLGFSHGTAELAGNLALSERTAHGVRTFAFGERFFCGLPAQQVLLQEFLVGWQPFGAVWRQPDIDAEGRRVLLARLIELLAALRDAGINHLDLHPGNVMVPADPQAPLRLIDCGQMSLEGDPALAAALHLGVFLHELNGRRTSPAPRLEEGARALFERLAGAEAGFARAERLLPLLLRHSTKKPFSRRGLLRRGAPDPVALERQLQRLAHSRRRSAKAAPALDAGDEQEGRIIASIEALLAQAF